MDRALGQLGSGTNLFQLENTERVSSEKQMSLVLRRLVYVVGICEWGRYCELQIEWSKHRPTVFYLIVHSTRGLWTDHTAMLMLLRRLSRPCLHCFLFTFIVLPFRDTYLSGTSLAEGVWRPFYWEMTTSLCSCVMCTCVITSQLCVITGKSWKSWIFLRSWTKQNKSRKQVEFAAAFISSFFHNHKICWKASTIRLFSIF